MRILHVYKDYYPILGGIENHIRVLAEGQAAAGHDVTVLVTNTAPVTRVEMMGGVRVIKAARLAHVASTPLSLSLPWQLAHLKPQITHLHFPYPVGEVAQYLLGRGEHTVLSYHSDVVRQQTILRFYRPLMRRVMGAVDRTLVASPNYLESSEVLQTFRRKCRVVPYGIDRRRFLNVDPKAARAVRDRYAPDDPLLLFVGVLRYYKGLQYLVEAMPHIPARLLIAGDGPMASSLREQVKALGLESRVILAGRVPDEELPAYYRAADLFVLPSSERSEAFGLVQVEAMSAGLPIVSTELGTGTSYVNKNDESGLVVPAQNPQALAKAVNTLLADQPLRQRLAAGALARSALFDRESMLAEIEQIYAELVDSKEEGI